MSVSAPNTNTPTPLATSEDIINAVHDASRLPASTPAGRTARRTLARRARALSLSHLVPPQWMRPAPHHHAVTAATSPAPESEPDPDPLSKLAARTGLPAPAVRAAYMRAVRDYAMTSPHLRPPPQLTRDMIAGARAAALARRADGDPAARSDDDDLLTTEGAP